MTRVDFYHLQKRTMEEVLPRLLLKAYGLGKKIIVKAKNFEQTEQLNSLLWTFSDESFLPHGSKKDGYVEMQPILLTADDDNSNNASYMFLVGGASLETEKIQNYERIFNIFDGKSPEMLQQARELWKQFKNSGAEVYYWQQNEHEKWEQKG